MMHLTNYAINKLNPEYEFATDEDGYDSSHKRSFTSVLEHLKQEGHDVDLLL
jgi:tubulin polyglutamylase TTLL6/13